MYNVLDVSQYVINYTHNSGYAEYMSNLKLQKVLYYIQAAFLVEKGKRCFDSPIVAWELGPVVPDAYNKYKIYGRRSIPVQTNRKILRFDSEKIKIIKDDSEDRITDSDKQLINKVVNSYAGVKDPFELVRKTHDENPWKNTNINQEIECTNIKEYYSQKPNKIYYSCA